MPEQLVTNLVYTDVFSRDVVLTKRCGNAPKKLAILKHLQTHFQAKHEKGKHRSHTFSLRYTPGV